MAFQEVVDSKAFFLDHGTSQDGYSLGSRLQTQLWELSAQLSPLERSRSWSQSEAELAR